MAYSQEFLKDLRKTLQETIETFERENAKLSAKIDSIRESSELEPEDDTNFLEELRLNEHFNGLAFRNVKKEILDETTFKIRADVVCGQEEYPLVVTAEEKSGKIEEVALEIGETTPLAEIKEDICSLVRDLHLTFTLNAMASFSHMYAVRVEILDDILNYYSDFFKVEAKVREDSDGMTLPDSLVVTALNHEGGGKYFRAIWYLKWNHGKIGIEHVFIIKQYPAHLTQLPRLVPKLNKLEAGGFFEKRCSKLAQLWRDIASIVANE